MIRALCFRRDQVVRSERQTAARCHAEAELVHVVQQGDRLAATEHLVAVADDTRELRRTERDVVERHALRQHHVEDDAADRGVDDFAEARLSLPNLPACSDTSADAP